MADSTLLDHTGRPFKRPAAEALSASVAAPTLTGVRQAWSGSSIAAGMTPERLARILRAAADGDAHDYLTLAEEMEERELHYACELGKRKLAVLGLDRVITPAGEDETAKTVAEAVKRDIIDAEAFDDLLGHAVDGLGKGYAVSEIEWATGAVFKPAAYHERDPRWFRYDRATGRELRLLDEANASEGVELAAYRFAVHEPKLKSGLPIRGGLARLAAWAFLFKSYSLKDWAAFAETFGQPLRVGKYGPGATPEDIEVLYQAVAMIGTDCGAVVPESMGLEFIESQAGKGGESLYERFCAYLDRLVSKAVLGQSGTADMQSGGGYAQSKTLDGVRGDLCEADARQLARTVRRDVIAPYVLFNFGPGAAVPLFKLQSPEAVDLKLLSDALTPFIDRGLKVRSSEVLAKFGFSAPEGDDEVLGAKAAPAPGATEADAAAPRIDGQAPVAENRAGCSCSSCASRARNSAETDAGDDLDGLVDDLTGGWAPAMDPLLEPVLRLAEASGSYAEFEAGLVDTAAAMDAGELARLLGPALFKARGLGDATDRPVA